jgi:hypothetical protein
MVEIGLAGHIEQQQEIWPNLSNEELYLDLDRMVVFECSVFLDNSLRLFSFLKRFLHRGVFHPSKGLSQENTRRRSVEGFVCIGCKSFLH